MQFKSCSAIYFLVYFFFGMKSVALVSKYSPVSYALDIVMATCFVNLASAHAQTVRCIAVLHNVHTTFQTSDFFRQST